jgi:hypothetical protein
MPVQSRSAVAIRIDLPHIALRGRFGLFIGSPSVAPAVRAWKFRLDAEGLPLEWSAAAGAEIGSARSWLSSAGKFQRS